MWFTGCLCWIKIKALKDKRGHLRPKQHCVRQPRGSITHKKQHNVSIVWWLLTYGVQRKKDMIWCLFNSISSSEWVSSVVLAGQISQRLKAKRIWLRWDQTESVSEWVSSETNPRGKNCPTRQIIGSRVSLSRAFSSWDYSTLSTGKYYHLKES